MAKSGIYTTVFKAHSTTSASTSAVAHKGAPMKGILDAVGLSKESSIGKFCKKKKQKENFGQYLLQGHQGF